MADIALTAASIGRVFPQSDEVYSFVAAAAITAGQALYLTSTGKVDLYDSNGSGTLQFLGIALNKAAAGQAVDVLKRGHVYGYTITSLAYFAPVYGSNTAGAFADAAGASSIICGRVVSISDNGNLTKVLYIEAPWRIVST
jgi:hypothetical protein